MREFLEFTNPTLLILYGFSGFIGYHLIPDLLKNIYPVSNWWGAIIGILIFYLGIKGVVHKIFYFIFDIPKNIIKLFKN